MRKWDPLFTSLKNMFLVRLKKKYFLNKLLLVYIFIILSKAGFLLSHKSLSRNHKHLNCFTQSLAHLIATTLTKNDNKILLQNTLHSSAQFVVWSSIHADKILSTQSTYMYIFVEHLTISYRQWINVVFLQFVSQVVKWPHKNRHCKQLGAVQK